MLYWLKKASRKGGFMKILGLGVPEMLIMLMLLVPVALVVALIVVLAKRAGSQQPLPYQRLSQLDDLYKRGAITEEEYALKKQECMRDL